MTVLVLGANGLLGSNVLAAAAKRGPDAVGTYHSTAPTHCSTCHELDIRDAERVAWLLDEYDPTLVVNCAAMTDVDGCETDPEHARAVNATAPGAIAQLCAQRGVPFTHVSTDYVFDGETDAQYDTDAPPNPLQVYGETKLAGDRTVREHHPDSTVVRLSFVYGVHRSRDKLVGFPAWVRDRLRDGEPTPLFTDQWVTPTRAGQAAETLLDLHDARTTGRYHVSCRSCVTPYEFGDQVRRRMGRSSDLLRRGSRADVERAARRPAYTCLDTGDVELALGRAQPTLAEDLDAVGATFE